MVLLLLAIGMLGETLRTPQASVASRSEHLQSPLLQFAGVTAKERFGAQSAEQIVIETHDDADDPVLWLSESPIWTARAIILSGAPRAPPVAALRLTEANRSRAPPSHMI